MRVLPSQEFIEDLYNPYTGSTDLVVRDGSVVDTTGNQEFRITDGIIEFSGFDEVDEHKKREISYTFEYKDEEKIKLQLAKHTWSSYYNYFQTGKFKRILGLIRRCGGDEFAVMGCGSGYDIGQLIVQGASPRRIYASDLSIHSVRIVPHQLRQFGYSGELALFTSDLDFVPIRSRKVPVIVFEALHHTPEMHHSIDKLLAYGYDNVIFVEPTNNMVIRWLARRGLAQRIEYSGLKPGRLELDRLRRMAETHGYDLSIRTLWEFPEDYFRRLPGNRSRLVEWAFLRALSVWSAISNIAKFGNMSIVHLTRKTAD
ncbi:hypothetical protein [Niveispirillum fermenti]|uniref:hypothetical protein n=1 Tax=Niveispirillum fermenti TaxID=1233113 RepID=UPI003A8B2DC8